MDHHRLLGRRPLFLSALGLTALASQVAPGCGRGLNDGNGRVSVGRPIGPEGGAVQLGQASLQAPAGALASTTTITVAREPATDSAPLGDVYQFGPEGLTFASPVTMKLPSPADADAGIGLWLGSEWEVVAGSRYDAQAGVVVGDVAHFSRYGCLRKCSSGATCSSGHECRRGVCQPPRDSGTGGSGMGGHGTGGDGAGGLPGTGGSGAGGTGMGGNGAGGVSGSGGTGSGGLSGSGGNVVGGMGGKGMGGMTGSGGGGGAGCPATQPVPIDMACPNPPQTCDYGTTRCICAAGRVWSCGPIVAGTGGSGGSCADGGTPTGCKTPGTACNANTECASGLCNGVTASGTGCVTDSLCLCILRPAGAACSSNAQCASGACLTSSFTACLPDSVCACRAPAG